MKMYLFTYSYLVMYRYVTMYIFSYTHSRCNFTHNLYIYFEYESYVCYVSETTGDFQRLLETMKDYQRLLQTFRDYWRLLETTRVYQRLLETIRDYLRLLETIRDHQAGAQKLAWQTRQLPDQTCSCNYTRTNYTKSLQCTHVHYKQQGISTYSNVPHIASPANEATQHLFWLESQY